LGKLPEAFWRLPDRACPYVHWEGWGGRARFNPRPRAGQGPVKVA
jgi:hypothetical protein